MGGSSQHKRLFEKMTRALGPLCMGLLGLTAALVIGCSNDEQTVPQPPSNTEGFTFFDVGETTVFSDTLRERLRKSLGPDAIAYRNIINLEVNGEGFLQDHFPVLHQLNLRLNTPAGERVEHNTVKLMYRYARNNDLPFRYVELVFSNHTGRPLFIHIYSRKDIADVLSTLEDKFGKPKKIDLPQESGQAVYWRDKKNVLLATIVPTRRGDQEYRLMIYFADNIEQLVSLEEKERREKEEERRRAGEKAF